MAEQNENTEDTPVGATSDDPYPSGATAYVELSDHVPDPTAMSGTLDTSGTGGGVHERITGMTRLFGEVEQDIVKFRQVVQRGAERVMEDVEHVIHAESSPLEPPQDPQERQDAAQEQEPKEQEEEQKDAAPAPAKKAPAKKAAAKKTATSPATK